MGNYDLDDLFGSFTAADALAETESKKKSFSNGLYKPSISDPKCVDGNYRSLVKFVPYFHEGKLKSTLERWECFLRDVHGDNAIYVVSPKTVGKNCPMRQMSYQLYKSGNAIDVENSRKISVYPQYYAIVEIVSDEQHPEYEGKHMIMQFGTKIFNKITTAMEGTKYVDPFNPFDPLNGKLFEVNLTTAAKQKVNDKPTADYEKCNFIEKCAPVHFTIKDEDGNDVEMTFGKDSRGQFIEWLENYAPKISDFFYKEWDAETLEKVNTNLASYKSDGYVAPKSTVAKAKSAVKDIDYVANSLDTSVETKKPVVVDDDDDDDAVYASGDTDDDAWVDTVLNG